MGLNINNVIHSDYGSGTSSESSSPWGLQDTWEEFHSRLQSNDAFMRRSSSFADLAARSKLDAKMQEFKLNGFDSPYDPDDRPAQSVGAGPSYLRQKSWPAPDASPAPPLPPRSPWTTPAPAEVPEVDAPAWPITEEQMRVLRTLPNAVLYGLLRQMERAREPGQARDGTGPGAARRVEVECRFCKNNGERASFYRGHALRAGGRVTCPVLRAFVCRRCGAHGDRAHTLKYCPLATADERRQSSAIMHSVRMASGKRRQPAVDVIDDYLVLRPAASPQAEDYAPLDPVWEALERKLMI